MTAIKILIKTFYCALFIVACLIGGCAYEQYEQTQPKEISNEQKKLIKDKYTADNYRIIYFKSLKNNFCLYAIAYKYDEYDTTSYTDLYKTQMRCIPCDSIKNSVINIIED